MEDQGLSPRQKQKKKYKIAESSSKFGLVCQTLFRDKIIRRHHSLFGGSACDCPFPKHLVRLFLASKVFSICSKILFLKVQKKTF